MFDWDDKTGSAKAVIIITDAPPHGESTVPGDRQPALGSRDMLESLAAAYLDKNLPLTVAALNPHALHLFSVLEREVTRTSKVIGDDERKPLMSKSVLYKVDAPPKRTHVIVVGDQSGSMKRKNKWRNLVRALGAYVQRIGLNSDAIVTYVGFSENAVQLPGLNRTLAQTAKLNFPDQPPTDSGSAARTHYVKALQRVKEIVDRSPADESKTVLFITDGIPDAELATKQIVQICIAFDVTGSMSAYFNALRDNLQTAVSTLYTKIRELGLDKFLEIELMFNAFGDYCDWTNARAPEGQYQLPFTSLADANNANGSIMTFLRGVQPLGGGDDPEFYELILHKVSTSPSWKPGSIRSVIVIGDAPPHEPSEYPAQQKFVTSQTLTAIDWRNVVNALRDKNIIGHALKCSKREIDMYKTLPTVTGGVSAQLGDPAKSPALLPEMLLAIVARMSNTDVWNEIEEAGKQY